MSFAAWHNPYELPTAHARVRYVRHSQLPMSRGGVTCMPPAIPYPHINIVCLTSTAYNAGVAPLCATMLVRIDYQIGQKLAILRSALSTL